MPSGEKTGLISRIAIDSEMTTVSRKEETFHRVSAALDRAKDQWLSGILERDHINVMRDVNELIEEHNEE